MGSLIRDRAAATADMLEVFGDEALVAAALRFEAALAEAQAAEGLVDAATARRIVQACAEPFDIPALAEAAAHAGTLAIPLVAELRRRVGDRDAAAVHRGATSQDVADTALVLQAQAGLDLLRRDVARIVAALAAVARTHAATPILARTLLQPAAATTFGLKAAQWRAGLIEAGERLWREGEVVRELQLGGAVGTLYGQGGRGAAVAAGVAERLGLRAPTAPWHTRRGGLAGLGSALAILTAATAKFARDVALLAQGEVGEAREPQVAGRGGSSAMNHKRNPTGCQVALSAAARTPHLAAGLIAGAAGEHERGLGGWQAEAPVLSDLFQLTHGAVAAMAAVAEGLEVDVAAMARNLAGSGVGEDLGEAVALCERLLEEAPEWTG